jgi:hypothetical protein
MGVCAASGRIGAMVAQLINGALVKDPVRLLLVASATLMLGAFTPCWLPGDMTGQPVNDDVRATVRSDRNASAPVYEPLQVQRQESCISSYSDDPTPMERRHQKHQDKHESEIV